MPDVSLSVMCSKGEQCTGVFRNSQLKSLKIGKLEEDTETENVDI